ncbi:GGDEF domain-containing protein [Lyngbya confervoides]|uniref:Diguanylate cyclase n=1 Tax=Lyngbya confervoides BDU141951 TaxID=1574623 RepID=A0ABD4T3R9_9CYAN|nr:diguanylate cyclase [Lyngbya confervoides]MCM1983085.1 diguanylate cyclase [Lyngbya confervoides BDU141951]
MIGELSDQLKELLNRTPKSVLQLVCIGLVGIIGALDYWVTENFVWFTLYLLPVGISAWSLGRRFSDFIVVLSAVVWTLTAFVEPTLGWNTLLWNTLFFVIMLWTISILLSNLRVSTELEQQLLRIDPITGAINKPFFMELLQAEYSRSQRYGYPLTLASLEIDRVEQMRASCSQEDMDALLAEIADQLGLQLRSNDVVARLNDFEFGILLPHTDSDQADVVLERLKEELRTHPVLRQSPLICRFGGMTFLSMPEATEDLITQTKQLLNSLRGDDLPLRYAHQVVH